MRSLFKTVAAALVLGNSAATEYASCSRPKGEFLAIDQGDGRSNIYGVTFLGSSQIIAVGHVYGNLSFSSEHIVNGATGETTSHEEVEVWHASGTFVGGRYTNVASSQNGMDSAIFKISSSGVPQAIFAMDTLPSDGKVTDSENGRSNGYSYMYDVDTFEKSGDNTSVVGCGSWRGNLTVPIRTTTTTTTLTAVTDAATNMTTMMNVTTTSTEDGETILTNRKNSNYDGFVVKVDADSMKGIWAVAPGQTEAGRNYARACKSTASGHVFVAMDKRPERTYMGRIFILDGATGETTYSADYDDASSFYALDTIGDYAFVGGQLTGSGIDPFGTGSITTGNEGADEEGFVAKIYNDGTGQWTTTIGEETRAVGASPDGNYIYAIGDIGSAWSKDDCTLTGDYSGFLVKLSASDGSCVWAKDIANRMRKVKADADYVYALGYDDEDLTFGDDLTLSSRGPEQDAMLVKWSASDGTGQWGTSIGGTGDDYGNTLAVSDAGVVIAGNTRSSSIELAGVTLDNLQYARSGGSSANSGERAGFIAMLDKDGQTPSCLSGCSSTTDDATVTSGMCYYGGECYDNGDADIFRACFSCAASTSQTTMEGPDTSNHCYIDGVCIETGSTAPAYQRYNQASVCEVCNPTIDPYAYSLVSGFIHDRDLARSEPGRNGRRMSSANSFGMVFEGSSNGCQVMPDLAMPSPVTSSIASGYAAAAIAKSVVDGSLSDSATLVAELAAADVNLLATAERAIGGSGEFTGLSTSARKAALDAMVTGYIPIGLAETQLDGSTLSTWQTAWAYYNGNQSSCATANSSSTSKTASGNLLCAATPSATAESHAAIFGTNLHYGNAIAVVKVKQALALGAANAEAEAPDSQLATAFTLDAKMHMMVPYYQGVLVQSWLMDSADTADARKAAQATAYVYFNLIEGMLLEAAGAEAEDIALALNPLSTPSGDNSTFCAVKNLLMAHLPNASALQYSQGASSGSTPSAADADALVSFVFEADIGTMPYSGMNMECAAYDATTTELPEALYKASIAVAASNSMSDFDSTAVKTAIKLQLAAALGVDRRRVGLVISAGSVMIDIDVNYTTTEAAEAGAATLGSMMSDATAASNFLSTPELSVTVTEITEEVSYGSVEDTGLSGGAIAGIIVGVIVALLLVVAIIVLGAQRKKEGKPIFVCLDDTKKETPAPTFSNAAVEGASTSTTKESNV
jgi:hypothetical protein